MDNLRTTPSSGCFPTTQWTQLISVIQSGDDAAAWSALEEFCLRYRPAIHNFFCRHGCSHHDAEEHTQAFFTSKIVEKWGRREGFLHIADRSKQVRFRSFLCTALWRFLQDQRKAQQSKKAGGQVIHVPLADVEFELEAADGPVSEKFGRDFDRIFAMEIIRRAAERSRHSKHLIAHLRGEISQAEAAEQLGIKSNAFKAAYSRFRQQLATDLWEEVAKLAGPEEEEIRSEIKYLMSLFAEGSA